MNFRPSSAKFMVVTEVLELGSWHFLSNVVFKDVEVLRPFLDPWIWPTVTYLVGRDGNLAPTNRE